MTISDVPSQLVRTFPGWKVPLAQRTEGANWPAAGGGGELVTNSRKPRRRAALPPLQRRLLVPPLPVLRPGLRQLLAGLRQAGRAGRAPLGPLRKPRSRAVPVAAASPGGMAPFATLDNTTRWSTKDALQGAVEIFKKIGDIRKFQESHDSH